MYAYSSISINGVFYSLKEAKTPEEKTKGLMFVKYMNKNQGMLFIYEKAKVIPIWMKNTYIPLDILWIGANHKIVDIQTGAPLSERILFPSGTACFVLELNRGETKRNKATIGTQVFLK